MKDLYKKYHYVSSQSIQKAIDQAQKIIWSYLSTQAFLGCHEHPYLYKVWFCKVEKGRQLWKLYQGGHDAATEIFPNFCISFIQTNLPLWKNVNEVFSHLFFKALNWNQTSQKYRPPLIAQQWKISWGTLIEPFCQIQSCLLQLRCKEALRQQVTL